MTRGELEAAPKERADIGQRAADASHLHHKWCAIRLSALFLVHNRYRSISLLRPYRNVSPVWPNSSDRALEEKPDRFRAATEPIRKLREARADERSSKETENEQAHFARARIVLCFARRGGVESRHARWGS